MGKNRFVIYFRRGTAGALCRAHHRGGLSSPGGRRIHPLHPRALPFRRPGKPVHPADRRHLHRQNLFRDDDPFFITLVLAVLFRKSFCGLLCPFGAIREFFGLLGKKIFRRNFAVPHTLDRPLRYWKYLVLVITVSFAWKTAGLWMAPYDPWAACTPTSRGDSRPLGVIPRRPDSPARHGRRIRGLRPVLLQVPLPDGGLERHHRKDQPLQGGPQ
ncbi:MAG: 4Fe-4S binding protein [Desulfobacterales bacterium]|nr:4Fe-4S binding protein [Desulfobacterales bacterium]